MNLLLDMARGIAALLVFLVRDVAVGGERIELVHRATAREVFALGALRAARWLCAADTAGSARDVSERGDRDLQAWVGYRLLARQDLSLYAELGAWFPTGGEREGIERVRRLRVEVPGT